MDLYKADWAEKLETVRMYLIFVRLSLSLLKHQAALHLSIHKA